MSMNDCNRDWVRRQLPRLATVYDARRRWKLLEPTNDMYKLLVKGEDEALQQAVDRIARHVSLSAVPSARYEWALRMAPEAAGDIKIGCHAKGGSLIRVPFFYVGKSYALGAILAHELTHHLNALDGIWESDRDENERLTDLSVIAAGLGKLTLNGLSAATWDIMPISIQLGYLDPEIILYAYELVNRHYGIGVMEAMAGLLPDIVSRLSALGSRSEG